MAQKTVVELFDDLDGTDAAETVHFGLDNTQYEIDLSQDHADELRDFLAQYVGAARRVRKDGAAVKPRKTHVRADAGDRKQKGAIRDWARANNFKVPDRGRLSREVLDAFETAHAVKPRGAEVSEPAGETADAEVFPTFASV